MVGMLEGVSGIGLVFGLLGGAGLYEAMGYKAVFIVFGGLLPVNAVVSRILFKIIDRAELEKEENYQKQLLADGPASVNEVEKES